MTDYSLMAKFDLKRAVSCFIEEKEITNIKELVSNLNVSLRKIRDTVKTLEQEGVITVRVIGVAKIISYNYG